MSFITYATDGQAVCSAHYLVVCGACCLDLTEFQEDSDQEQENDDDDDDDDDRVFVLGTGVNRFIPQCDDQIKGPSNTFMIRMDHSKPPEPAPLQASDLHACSECELTWLVGSAGHDAAAGHPSHYTLYHEYAGTRRSLVVHTDGACIDNGQAGARAGVGIYFGPRSKYNVSEPLTTSTVPTNQKAELTALIRAMQVVHDKIVPTRSLLVQGDRDRKHFRLVLVTDSSYAVECMCKHFSTWTVDDEARVVRNKQGKMLVNSELLLAVQDEVEKLSRVGVQVTYYHVGRDLNKDADALAKLGATA